MAIKIDFQNGFQAIQTKGVHYHFSFASLQHPDHSELMDAAAGIIREFTETDISDCTTTFIRDSQTGDIYAVAIPFKAIRIQQMIQFPEGKEHFLHQFADWVLMEQPEAQQFNLQFTDMIDGWLPDHWRMIQKCLESPTRGKSKHTTIKKWEHGNHVLTFCNETGVFTFSVVSGSMLFPVCKFYPNEKFTEPEQ